MEGFSPLSDCQKFLSSHSKALNQIMWLSAGFFLPNLRHNTIFRALSLAETSLSLEES